MRGCALWLLAGAMVIVLAGCETGGGGDFSFARAGADNKGRYTILLYTFIGPRHVEQSAYYKRSTEKMAGWKGLYVVHEDNLSKLFWGKYRSFEAAQPHLKRAHQFQTKARVKVYAGALVVAVPGEDVGPAEWNLRGAEGAYSVVVAVFFDVPKEGYAGRKKFAADYCRRLRKNGYEAYYFHGANRSAVSIGAFGAECVKQVRHGDHAEIIPNDPRIKKIMADFPRLAVNGSGKAVSIFNPNTRQYDTVIQKTYLVKIPRGKNNDVQNAVNRVGDAQQRQSARD